jgi:hypothetical protein
LSARKIGLPAASIDADCQVAAEFDDHLRGCQLSRLLGGGREYRGPRI